MLGPECLEILGGGNSNKLTAQDEAIPCGMMEDLEIDENKLTPEDKAIPYTCMASFLLAGWDWEKMDDCSAIRIKIQGIISGLCRIEFENRTEYEVLVQFFDGSCESQVHIHHKLVQSRIGLTPEQVSSALTSERHCNMRKTLDDFQEWLFSFTGVLILVRHRSSPYPVVVKMYSTSIDESAWDRAKDMHISLHSRCSRR